MAINAAALCRDREGMQEELQLQSRQFRVKSQGLQLGQLAGNRSASSPWSEHPGSPPQLLLDKACEQGFPNYYGSQRYDLL